MAAVGWHRKLADGVVMTVVDCEDLTPIQPNCSSQQQDMYMPAPPPLPTARIEGSCLAEDVEASKEPEWKVMYG